MRAFKEELKIPPEKFKDPKLLLKEAKPSDELDKFGDQIFGE